MSQAQLVDIAVGDLNVVISSLAQSIETQRLEIRKLEDLVGQQNDAVSFLMKSHVRKSRLAIRFFLNDAKKVKDKTVFSVEALTFLEKHKRTLSDDEDRAARFNYTRERIRDAILHYDQFTTRRILIELYEKIYRIPIEEEDDFTDYDEY